MDEGRKRTLAVLAAILAERRLSERAAEGNDGLRVKIISDAMQNAERILNTVDARWPKDRIPGKT